MLIYLLRAATISTARWNQLPCFSHTSATLAEYLATFRPFWRLFSHNRYILTNLATFLKKTLAIVQLEEVARTAPRALALTLPVERRAASPLSVSLLSSERQRSSTLTQQTRHQQIIYKTAFPSTCRLLTVWTFKYEHNSSVNMRIACYSDAGSALNDTKQ